MAYEAKIVLDSVGPNDARLTTFELSYPRFVHAELMTHRVFSRNSASSRAIPTERLLSRIEIDPVLPKWWGRNQSGMQAREELDGIARVCVEKLWREAILSGVDFARRLGQEGLHKQIANRAAELGMFITVVVTATEFSNFFALRDHTDAQPELADVAAKAHRLHRESAPRALAAGDWHLPYVEGHDLGLVLAEGLSPQMVSVGRCAAVSYLNQDKRDPAGDLERARKNLAAGHMSPFEHVAEALTAEQWWAEGERAMHEWVYGRVPPGNLWGWRQYRKTLASEHDFGVILLDRAAT